MGNMVRKKSDIFKKRRLFFKERSKNRRLRRLKMMTFANLKLERVYTYQTLNNFYIVWRNKKRVLYSKTAGGSGFCGSKRGTPFAAEVCGQKVSLELKRRGVKRVRAVLRTPLTRIIRSGLKGLHEGGIRIKDIIFELKIPHNGCRLKGRRRL